MDEAIFYIIIGLIAIILIYILITVNRLTKAKNKVEEGFSTMDVYLKMRWDLIPNLIETIKGYSIHEKKTLEEVIRLRNTTYDNMDEKKKLNTDDALNIRIPKLLAVSESYPELKANDSYQSLQTRLSEVEIDIANSRKNYNESIRLYNDLVEMFPSNIIAKIMKFNKREIYSIEEEGRENVRIDL